MNDLNETDCTITHGGQAFTAGGAFVDDHVINAYLGTGDANYGGVRHKRCVSRYAASTCVRACCAHRMRSGPVKTWHGETIGRYTLDSSREQWGTRVYYVTVHLSDGRTYACRGQGAGMVCSGKRLASQLKEGAK